MVDGGWDKSGFNADGMLPFSGENTKLLYSGSSAESAMIGDECTMKEVEVFCSSIMPSRKGVSYKSYDLFEPGVGEGGTEEFELVHQ